MTFLAYLGYICYNQTKQRSWPPVSLLFVIYNTLLRHIEDENENANVNANADANANEDED